MVLREALLMVPAGIALGAPAALGAARLARSPLFGIRPDNPAVLLLSLAVLVLAGLGAGLAPPTAPPPSTRSRPCAQNDDS